jgi:23S rRNA pseudouridine1911/1915/1917 synthase
MHQIRLQFASRGWPLVGDYAYGARGGLGPKPNEDPRAEPIALHARLLTFLHPIRYDRITVQAPLPANWGAFLDPTMRAELGADIDGNSPE